MNKLTISILTLFLFATCTIKNDHYHRNQDAVTENKDIPAVSSVGSANVLDAKNDSITGCIGHGSGFFSLKFNVSDDLLKSIKVYEGSKLIQVIAADKEIQDKHFELIDWNFDGYKDITVTYNCGSGGCAYWIWNYSPKDRRFHYNKELSEVLGLEIDTTLKNIIFHYRAGWQEEYSDTFRYDDDKLTFIKGSHFQRWTDNKGKGWQKRTHKERINNVLKTKVYLDSTGK